MCLDNGTCGMCGAAGQPCCANMMCTAAGTICGGGMGGGAQVCEQCGATGQPCCANRMCGTGLTCTMNRCG
jgi:hypothetical protein